MLNRIFRKAGKNVIILDAIQIGEIHVFPFMNPHMGCDFFHSNIVYLYLHAAGSKSRSILEIFSRFCPYACKKKYVKDSSKIPLYYRIKNAI